MRFFFFVGDHNSSKTHLNDSKSLRLGFVVSKEKKKKAPYQRNSYRDRGKRNPNLLLTDNQFRPRMIKKNLHIGALRKTLLETRL